MKQKKLKWMRLDNAAKIFPAVKRKNWSNVFRLSATLNEPIDTEILQSALETTVKRFPSIAVRIRRGLFWYYLEEIDEVPSVIQDEAYPCSRMHFRDIRKCAFRVLYYENRIAAEFFHALTDGNGGLVFLKTLVAEYLTQKHQREFSNGFGVLDRQQEPTEGELEDSFLKYEGTVSSSRSEANSFRLFGTLERNEFQNITTGIIDVNEILNKAKQYKVSLTTFLVSVMIQSIMDIQDKEQPRIKRQKPVKICVPVNLRSFFDSTSLRNFVLYINPGIDPRYGEFSFEEILKSIHHQMGFDLTKKRLNAKITTNVRAEKYLILKIAPLFLKNLTLKIVYNMVGEKKSALSISNLGVVQLPEDIASFVDRLDFVLGVQATSPSNCGVLSYKDKLYINFIRNIEEPTLEHKFFTNLKTLGITAKIESNQRNKYHYEIAD